MEIHYITTFFLAILLLIAGNWIVSNVKLLDRYSIPAPVVGGLLIATLVFMLHQFQVIQIVFDTTLQEIFMLVFYTTVGLSASFALIKKGGKLLLVYWAIVGVLALLQNVIGISMARLFGLDPLIGVMTGSVSMLGGHGAAAAFGGTIESLGVEGAITAGIATATFGLVVGGIIGGPIVRYLIKKNKLSQGTATLEEIKPERTKEKEVHESTLTANRIFLHLGLITFCMSIGSYLGDAFTDWTGFVLPNYVGAMVIAVIARNLLDRYQSKETMQFSNGLIALIGAVALGVFLAMALMSIKLWEIVDLALPLLTIALIQVIIVIIIGIFLLFPILGKNYDAAVMIGGFAGHGVGAVPTAMANMDAITQKYGHSKQAFLIVPIVGAFLVDFISLPIIIFCINYFS